MLHRPLSAGRAPGAPRRATFGAPRRGARPVPVYAAAATASMRPQNVEGSFAVDETCIDCDTCRWMAPDVFNRAGGKSAVFSQPTDAAGRVRALQALLSCPTNSIHARARAPEELRQAQAGLPALVPGTQRTYHCGWHDVKSFAAASYVIARPQGNVMIDCPHWSPVLARQIEAMGGVRYIFLTHRDDVGDHARWARHFQAQRILHSLEVNSGTKDVEVQLQGTGPWRLPDGGDDATLIFTPGHTAGHVCLFFAPDKALLSGDHLSASYEDPSTLYIFTTHNWYSVPIQLDSVRQLLDHDWLHVLPGHGRPAHLQDAFHRLAAVTALLDKHGARATA